MIFVDSVRLIFSPYHTSRELHWFSYLTSGVSARDVTPGSQRTPAPLHARVGRHLRNVEFS